METYSLKVKYMNNKLNSKNTDFLFYIKPRCEMLVELIIKVLVKTNKTTTTAKQFFSVYLIELISAVHKKCQIGSVMYPDETYLIHLQFTIPVSLILIVYS